MKWLFNIIFGCWHRNTTTPRAYPPKTKSGCQTYVACLDCGAHIPYLLGRGRLRKFYQSA